MRLLRSTRAWTLTHALERVIPSGASAKSRDLSSRRSGDGAEAGSAGQSPSNTLGEIPRHRSAQPNGLGITALCHSKTSGVFSSQPSRDRQGAARPLANARGSETAREKTPDVLVATGVRRIPHSIFSHAPSDVAAGSFSMPPGLRPLPAIRFARSSPGESQEPEGRACRMRPLPSQSPTMPTGRARGLRVSLPAES